jgi:hypothetical protein
MIARPEYCYKSLTLAAARDEMQSGLLRSWDVQLCSILHLFKCLLSSPKANYKVKPKQKKAPKQRHARKQKTKKKIKKQIK